jgi:hypothetical protein
LYFFAHDFSQSPRQLSDMTNSKSGSPQGGIAYVQQGTRRLETLVLQSLEDVVPEAVLLAKIRHFYLQPLNVVLRSRFDRYESSWNSQAFARSASATSATCYVFSTSGHIRLRYITTSIVGAVPPESSCWACEYIPDDLPERA